MDADNQAADLVAQLLSTANTDPDESTTLNDELQERGYQRKICEELLDLLSAARGAEGDVHRANIVQQPQESFIRTSISEYQTPAPEAEINIRDALGGISSSITSQLAEVLTRLLTHRVDRENLLPGTQDVGANMEAMGMMEDEHAATDDGKPIKGGAKSAMTISSLGLTAARLYVELLGTKGAWGAGLVDVGGISAISALVRRWCVECRGREPGMTKDAGKPAKKKAKPSSYTSKGTRKSVRINANATFTESDDESVKSNNGDGSSPDLNATFFVDDEYLTDKLSEPDLISGGLKLAKSLGLAALQMEYKNWSSEAREAYLDAVCMALGTASALLTGCKTGNVGDLCRLAVNSLERALYISVLPSKVEEGDSPAVILAGSRKSKKTKSPKEELASKKRMKESTIYVLRGLLPIFNLKVELPNGQSGKVAAYETATALLVKIVSTISEEIQISKRNQLVRLSNSSANTTTDSQTPRRGGRKSISFSHTPGAGKSKSQESTSPLLTLQPPSLKKSITPRRTRSGQQFSSNENTIHPTLILIMGMLHKLFTSKGLERADARGRVTNIGIACLTHFPSLERAQLLKFIGEMSTSKVSSHRLLAVEMIGEVLCTDWYWADLSKKNDLTTPRVVLDASTVGEACSNKLLAALMGRLHDKSPTVRMRVAFSLSEVVRKASDSRENERDSMENIDFTPKPKGSKPASALVEELCKVGSVLVGSLRMRASTDEKATVRKASIMAWLQMLSLAHREKNEDCIVSALDISTLCALCNDNSVATRKAAAEALTKLVQSSNYDSEEYTSQASALEMAWAHTVLPLVRDVELTCVTKCLEFFSSLVVEPIIENGCAVASMLETSNSRYVVAWRILSKISIGSQEAGGSRNGIGSLETAIQKLLINAGSHCKSLSKNLLKSVYNAGSMSLGLDRRGSDSFLSQQSEVDCDLYRPSIQSMRTGAWCLLDALTSCLLNGNGDKVASTSVSLKQAVRASSIDSSFLALSLKKLRSLINSPDVPFDKRPSLIIASRDCFKVTAKMASFVPIQEAEDCFSDLFNDLKTFRMVIDLIPAAVSALVALSKRLCDDSGKDVFHECEQWITKLLIQCERAMESSLILLARRSGSVEVEEKITRISFLVGELSIVGFSSDDVPGKGIKNLATEKEPVRGLAVRPSAQLLQSIKLMMPNSMPVPGSPDDAFVPIPSAIRAHGFVTMGKLCLRDERLAKECLNILARELHRNTTTDPAVQTNCLMVMGDLCVRYTNLVDKYLPFMAACIQAGDAKGLQVVGPETYSRLSVTFDGTTGDYSLVKKNAILLLSSLLLQDYIKWRGLFVFRFLAGVADKDDEVSCLARAAIRGPLLEKQPNLLSSSFVESIFVFNNYKAHPIYATAASSGGAGCVEIDFEPGILDGTEGYQRRHEVYQMMLENMSGEQKLKVTTDIVKRILGGALETSGDLGIVCRLAPKVSTKISISRIDSATHVLRDALAILSSPQIKVGRRVSDVAEQDDEFAEGSNAKTDQRNVNKERLLSKISRKHLMEIVIPVLCNLKSVLETSHSTLLKDLMKYLGYIFRSFKREVSEQLANDPTLLQELEYDTRQFEKNQRESILNAEIVAGDA